MGIPMLVGDPGGVVRLSTQSPAGDGTKPGDLPANSEVRGEGGLPGVKGGVGDSSNAPPKGDIDPAHVVQLQKAAQAGDPEAMQLLKALGIGAGVAGAAYGGYKLYQSMKGRNKSVPTEEAASPSNKGGTARVPQQPEVTRLNEVEIPRTSGYLPAAQAKLPAPPQRLLTGPNGAALEEAAKAARYLK